MQRAHSGYEAHRSSSLFLHGYIFFYILYMFEDNHMTYLPFRLQSTDGIQYFRNFADYFNIIQILTECLQTRSVC